MYIGNETQSNLLGWAALAIIGVQIALPLVMKRKKDAMAAITEKETASTWPMGWVHYLLGFLLPLAAFVHAWIPMASGKMPQTSMSGLWAATFALGFMLVQVILGVALQRMRGMARLVLRRVHFVGMLIISALVLAHIILN